MFTWDCVALGGSGRGGHVGAAAKRGPDRGHRITGQRIAAELGTEPHRPLALASTGLGHRYRAGTRMPRCDDGKQPYGPAAEHSDRPTSQVTRQTDGVHGRGQRLDQRRPGVTEAGRDDVEPACRRDEGVRHRSGCLAADHAEAFADVVPAGLAVRALAADEVRLQDDPCARRGCRHTGTGRVDHSHHLVSWHARQRDERMRAGQCVQVRPADADDVGPYPDLARSRYGKFGFPDLHNTRRRNDYLAQRNSPFGLTIF